MPQTQAGRYETMQWLMFQMGGIGRCSAARLLHKIRRPRDRGQGPRDRYVRGPAPARRARRRLEAATGSWAASTASPTSRPSRGCAHLVGFYEAGELVRLTSSCSQACAAGPSSPGPRSHAAHTHPPPYA
jgi:GST-like protein